MLFYLSFNKEKKLLAKNIENFYYLQLLNSFY